MQSKTANRKRAYTVTVTQIEASEAEKMLAIVIGTVWLTLKLSSSQIPESWMPRLNTTRVLTSCVFLPKIPVDSLMLTEYLT